MFKIFFLFQYNKHFNKAQIFALLFIKLIQNKPSNIHAQAINSIFILPPGLLMQSAFNLTSICRSLKLKFPFLNLINNSVVV